MASQDNGEGSSTGAQKSFQQVQGLGLGLDLELGMEMDFSVSAFGEGEEGGEGGEGAEGGEGDDGEENEVDDGMTPQERARNKRNLAAAEYARASITESALAAHGVDPNLIDSVTETLEEDTLQSPQKSQKSRIEVLKNDHDLFTRIGNYPELYMELAIHLRTRELVSLYSISRDFHGIINGRFLHCIRAYARYHAKESSKIFLPKFYASLLVPDPAGTIRPNHPDKIRIIPGLKWLKMVVHREKAVRDILACLARQGHRMATNMSLTLKKMWLLMDISTTMGRAQLMRSNMFSDLDLYNIQMFVVKLDMRFNDPTDGPGNETLRKLFLGQRGLTPLCKLLKRESYLTYTDIMRTAIRYAYNTRPEHRYMPIFGVPPEEIGIGHLEGWGAGRVHLARPDELVVRESVRRGLKLKDHIMGMMLWGYVDPISGENIAVTEEEMYMSDDEGKQCLT